MNGFAVRALDGTNCSLELDGASCFGEWCHGEQVVGHRWEKVNSSGFWRNAWDWEFGGVCGLHDLVIGHGDSDWVGRWSSIGECGVDGEVVFCSP